MVDGPTSARPRRVNTDNFLTQVDQKATDNAFGRSVRRLGDTEVTSHVKPSQDLNLKNNLPQTPLHDRDIEAVNATLDDLIFKGKQFHDFIKNAKPYNKPKANPENTKQNSVIQTQEDSRLSSVSSQSRSSTPYRQPHKTYEESKQRSSPQDTRILSQETKKPKEHKLQSRGSSEVASTTNNNYKNKTRLTRTHSNESIQPRTNISGKSIKEREVTSFEAKNYIPEEEDNKTEKIDTPLADRKISTLPGRIWNKIKRSFFSWQADSTNESLSNLSKSLDKSSEELKIAKKELLAAEKIADEKSTILEEMENASKLEDKEKAIRKELAKLKKEGKSEEKEDEELEIQKLKLKSIMDRTVSNAKVTNSIPKKSDKSKQPVDKSIYDRKVDEGPGFLTKRIQSYRSYRANKDAENLQKKVDKLSTKVDYLIAEKSLVKQQLELKREKLQAQELTVQMTEIEDREIKKAKVEREKSKREEKIKSLTQELNMLEKTTKPGKSNWSKISDSIKETTKSKNKVKMTKEKQVIDELKKAREIRIDTEKAAKKMLGIKGDQVNNEIKQQDIDDTDVRSLQQHEDDYDNDQFEDDITTDDESHIEQDDNDEEEIQEESDIIQVLEDEVDNLIENEEDKNTEGSKECAELLSEIKDAFEEKADNIFNFIIDKNLNFDTTSKLFPDNEKLENLKKIFKDREEFLGESLSDGASLTQDQDAKYIWYNDQLLSAITDVFKLEGLELQRVALNDKIVKSDSPVEVTSKRLSNLKLLRDFIRRTDKSDTGGT